MAKPGEARALQALNRQQRYRTTFRSEGIEIVPQAGTGASWRLGLSVTGYGYEGDLRSLKPAKPEALKERVAYRRGPVTEWYVNRPGGLEQGFEIAEPETRRNEPIALAMAVDGGLELRLDDAGVASFRDAAGETRVRYVGLAAWDADGRALVSRLETSDRELRLVVEAQAARFPVTVDPTFVQEARLEGQGDPIGTAGETAGQSVSVSGDTAVVGAYAAGGVDAGSVYVFVRSGTAWAEQQKLVASDGSPPDYFGWSVSISGDTALVGAYGDDDGAGPYEGSAYVFVRSGAAWTEQRKLVASDGVANDSFGQSVSVSGDTAVVGAPGDNTTGSVYVFARSGTVWTEQQKLVASDAAPNDYFGTSVSVSGETAVVGSLLADTAGGSDAGSAYVFVRSGTVWTEQQKLVASDGTASDYFGVSVSVSGDTAVVGANGDDTGPGGYTGSAYVFVRSGTAWTEQQKLVASDGAADDNFGISVSVSGDTAVAGAYAHNTAGGLDAGSAYVFVRSGTVWTEQQKLLASDGALGDRFGASVSLSGDTAMAGAYGDDTAGGLDAGSAYAFVRSGTVWTEQQKLLASDGELNDQFGASVSVSGDTALVGAYADDTATGLDTGSAYVFVRSGTVWTEQQKLVASDAAFTDAFGWSVSVSGDTAVVGARHDDTTGSAYVFVRSGTVWTEQQKLVASDGAAFDEFGTSVSVSGDTAVVGARRSGGEGAAYVFVRSGTVWTEQQKLVASDGAALDEFGTSVSVSGDTVVVGASQATTAGGLLAGAAYVFVRSGTAWTEQQKLLASDAEASQNFGVSVSVSVDTAVVGARYDDTPAGMEAGAAYVFVRSGTTWSEQQTLLASDGAAFDNFGASVSISGDMALVGANQDDAAGGGDVGSAYVFLRSGTVWTEQQKLVASDGAAGDFFGVSVSVSGDTAVVGAQFDDSAGGEGSGSAYVFREGLVADLAVTKTDGQTTAVPGQQVTYTIGVANAGPDDATGATVIDTLSAALQGATWTCTASPGSNCTASGAGSINDTVDLLVNGTATYTLMATIDPAATGTLDNGATVAAPAGTTDPTPGNNSATDSDTLTPEADLSATKTDGQTTAVPGSLVTYTITVANAGPSIATGATVTDTVPAALLGASWTCSASPGSTCTPSGLGSINDTVDLLAGGSATYTLTGTVDPAATGTLINTVAAAAPSGVTDPSAANNSATDTDTLLPAGLSIEGELAHGSRGRHDLAALPGPLADEDVFLILQRAHASYEVLLDGASGDLGSGSGPLLERLAADASTVLQGSSPAGAGGSRSLRWMNALGTPVADELVRVRSAGCTTDCDAADVYRLGARETTGFIPRYNNSGSQVSVLVLQNLGDEAVDVDVRFWSGAGAPLGGSSIQTLGPRASYVLNTSTIAPGSSGSISVANTGRYGQLTGKAVAVEPATGFTFDTAMAPRPR